GSRAAAPVPEMVRLALVSRWAPRSVSTFFVNFGRTSNAISERTDVMTNWQRTLGLVLLYGFSSVWASAQMLWKPPEAVGISGWTWGPGGREIAPQAPFEFIREKMDGTNPKVEVRDAGERLW